MASADAPMKGIATLLEAFAKLRTERDLGSCSSPSPEPGGRTEQLVDRLGIADAVTLRHGVSDAELVEVMGSAEMACVPSLYEGFSLPTAELMACATPLVVVPGRGDPRGRRGRTATAPTWSTPGDVGELEHAIGRAARRPRAPGSGWARPAAAGRWSASAGAPSPRPPPRRTRTIAATVPTARPRRTRPEDIRADR